MLLHQLAVPEKDQLDFLLGFVAEVSVSYCKELPTKPAALLVRKQCLYSAWPNLFQENEGELMDGSFTPNWDSTSFYGKELLY